MIRPRPKPGLQRMRLVAIAATVVLLLGVQVAMRSVPLPVFASSREVIRELDPLMLERLVTPPPEEELGAREEESPDEPEADVEAAPRPSFEQEVGLAMEELERRFSEVGAPEDIVVADGPEPEVGAAPGISQDLADASEDRFESLFGIADGVAAGRATRDRDAAAGSGLGIGINERAVSDSPGGAGLTGGAGGPAVTVEAGSARGTEPQGEEVTIGSAREEEPGRSEAAQLADWMRANPSELPIGIRAHVNYQPSFLTAVTRVTQDGQAWEMYLMFNEALEELHLVLVRGDESVYLIDRGFQKQSRSLREGRVRRADGAIVAVDSRTGVASAERTQEFYDVFLSWWDSTRSDAGAP